MIILIIIIIIIIIIIMIIIMMINIKWPVILVLYSYIARREYVNSRWINVKCLYIENQQGSRIK